MRTRLVTVLLALITAFLVIPGAAATADEEGGESLHGQIVQPDDRDQGVEGIEITVFQEGDEIGVGSVVGLIEAMKLFNEIKSDVGGRVTRTIVESGTLVKRQQPLLEVDPRG